MKNLILALAIVIIAFGTTSCTKDTTPAPVNAGPAVVIPKKPVDTTSYKITVSYSNVTSSYLIVGGTYTNLGNGGLSLAGGTHYEGDTSIIVHYNDNIILVGYGNSPTANVIINYSIDSIGIAGNYIRNYIRNFYNPNGNEPSVLLNFQIN